MDEEASEGERQLIVWGREEEKERGGGDLCFENRRRADT